MTFSMNNSRPHIVLTGIIRKADIRARLLDLRTFVLYNESKP